MGPIPAMGLYHPTLHLITVIMFSLFLFLVFVLAAYGMYLHFSRPRYRTIRTLEQPLPNDQVSVSVNVPVTGVTWVSRPPQTLIVEEEEEIFVDSPIDPLDLMMDAMVTEELIDEGPMVIESGYGYGADVVDDGYNGGVVEVDEDDDDVDYGSGYDF